MRLPWLPTLATLGLAACNDPTFDVTIVVMPGTGVPGNDLADRLERTQQHLGGTRPEHEVLVSVIDPLAAGEALVPPRAATCDDIAFGRIPTEVLDAARRASVTMGRGAQLSGVPREGDKLVMVEARTRGGRRIGGGCEPYGTVTSDATVEVELYIAPTFQVFGRMQTIEPSSVRLLLLAPWDEKIVVPIHPVMTDAHASGMTASVLEDSELGQYETPVVAPPDGTDAWSNGPAQTVVRVKWAEDVVRIPSFRPWPTIETGGSDLTLAASTTPGFSPRWALRTGTSAAEIYRFAAALQEAPGAEVVVVEYQRSSGTLRAITVPAPGVEAVAFFGPAVVTVVPAAQPGMPGVWRGLNEDGMPVGWGPAVSPGAATQIHTVVDCDGGGDDARLLVRHGTGAPYTAYRAPGNAAPADDPMTALAARLNAAGEDLIASACLTLDDGSDDPPQMQVVLSRGGGLGLNARLVSDPDEFVILPDVSSAATFAFSVPGSSGLRSLAVGAEATISGPRARSYKLTELPIAGQQLATGFVAEGRIDTPLATLPSSIDVLDVDRDGAFDLVAALPTFIGSRVQVNLGEVVAGEPLSAVTDIVRGGRRSSNAIVRFLDVDAVGAAELIIATDDGIEVLCVARDALSPDRPPGSARCVP